MFRKKIPRVYEIIDLIPKSSALMARLRDFDRLLADEPEVRKEFLALGKELQEVDKASWDHFKSEVAQLLTKETVLTEWRQITDRIRSEVKGYVYLLGIGCKEIRPIPRGPRRTPDWQAVLDGRKVLCEVKTINTSKREMEFRKGNRVRCPDADTGTSWTLSEGFLKQIAGKIRDAEDQLKGFNNSIDTRRIAFIVLNFDDILSGHVDLYFKQIQEFLCGNPVLGMSVVCYGKTNFGEGQLTLDWHDSIRYEPILTLTMP